MSTDERDSVELPALKQLQSLGWSYVEAAELSPDGFGERGSFKDVVLEKRLAASIKRINPWIDAGNLSKVVRDLIKTPHSNLIEANQFIWNALNRCVSVMQDLGKGNKGQTVRIIDFQTPESNEFLCTSQFKVSGVHQNIIPDIVLFVNGLPLAVIECKSPYITDPMQAGINQLLRYANRRSPSDDEGAEKLFYYNQMMVSSCGSKARFGSITSRMEHYLEWKDPYPLNVEQVGSEANSQGILIAGLFSKANFLDIVQNFTVFEPVDGRTVKKIARYQQFRAVHKTIKRIKAGSSRREKGGVIWHTQGSGKSLTMVFLTIKMRRDPELRDRKLVFLTDRTQLDTQLNATFTRAQSETVQHADSIESLKELLMTDSSNIVIATVQKFQERTNGDEFPVLNESEKIIVLTDEAHRTQYGTLGAALNSALPNAPKIAFTGTPLIKTQKTSREFGSYIDTYTIEEAVKDGATIQIVYEGREAELQVAGGSLDNLFEDYLSDSPAEEKAAVKKKYGTEKAILEAPLRIREVCADILEHYCEHIQPNGFKAMIATSSRKAAITYKEQLDRLEAPESAVIISCEQNDPKRFREHTDGNKHKRQIEDFKKPFGTGEGQSDLSFLIVKDMLLTGFDAPIAQVMYLDRKLSDHNLLQAIARVNRPNRQKFRGYIVDYYGLSDYIDEALSMFSTDDVQGALIELKDEIPKLKNSHTRVIQYFKGLDMDDWEECILALEDAVKRRNFQADFQVFARQMDIILPNPAAAPFCHDLKNLGKITLGAKNRYRDEQLDITAAGEKVRRLIEEHVDSTGIATRIAPVDLFGKDLKERLGQYKSSRSRASEMVNAIRSHIKVNFDDDPEYYKSLSERLEDIIRRHGEKWDELVQGLIDLGDNMEADHKKKADDLGLSMKESPFYNILEAEIQKPQAGESPDEERAEKLKMLTRSLVSKIEEATHVVGFWEKWDEQKRVRKIIRRALIEHFDESPVKAVSDRFMELAKRKFK